MVLEKIKEVIAEHLDMDASEINESTSFEDLGIDSLETVEIMMELEDELGVEISAGEAGKTVGSLVSYVESLSEGE